MMQRTGELRSPASPRKELESLIMAITIAQIKELREATAAGMGACKEALTATNGDMNEAI